MAVSTTYSAARNNKRHLLMMPPVAGLHLLLLVLLLRRDSSERRWFQPSSPSCAGFAASQSLESADNFIDAGHFNPEDGACGDLGPWTEGMCLSDGTAGGENEHCGPCLVGEAWDRLRATLGTEEVRRARSTVPTIKHAQWLSSTLAGTVIHILLKELLGYDRIRVVTTGNQFEIEEAASEACQGINMEVWLTEPEVEQRLLVEAMDAQPGRAVAGLTGGVGSESLFVPSYLPFSSTHYWPLQENVREERNGSLMRPMERFPPDGSFGAEQLASAFPAGDPWGCSTAGYGYGTFVCTAGRWYVDILMLYCIFGLSVLMVRYLSSCHRKLCNFLYFFNTGAHVLLSPTLVTFYVHQPVESSCTIEQGKDVVLPRSGNSYVNGRTRRTHTSRSFLSTSTRPVSSS